MGLLDKLLGYRWSLYIVKNGNEAVYVMHENSVLRMVGYVMQYYKEGRTPNHPWSIHLNFNSKRQAFELTPTHFSPDGENVTQSLISKIKGIDPGWQVKGGEPVFEEVATKKRLNLRSPAINLTDNRFEFQKYIDNQSDEPTFFSIMDSIFRR